MAALVYLGIHATVFLMVQTFGIVKEGLALRSLSSALAQVRQEDAHLQQQIRLLSEDEEIIRLARRNEGYVFPGEEIYRIPDAQSPPEESERVTAPRQSSRAREFWEGLRRLLFPRSGK